MGIASGRRWVEVLGRSGAAKFLRLPEVELVVVDRGERHFEALAKGVSRVPTSSDFISVNVIDPCSRYSLPEDAWGIILRKRMLDGEGWRAEVTPKRVQMETDGGNVDLIVHCRAVGISTDVFMSGAVSEIQSRLQLVQEEIAQDLIELGDVSDVELF